MKRTLFAFALFASAILCLAGPAFSQTLTILHSFGDGSVVNDGTTPVAPLVEGADGNLYGTTEAGGAGYGNGTVFEVTPTGRVTIIHSFGDGSVADDGGLPEAGLVEGTNGDYYGTTYSGEASYGTVFEITPSGSVTILHRFGTAADPNDGETPASGLVLGNDGSFYGTTLSTAFKITPGGSLTILHSFGEGSVKLDGTYPFAALVQGSDGNFYGTTSRGGTVGGGTVFRLTPTGHETILHSFLDGTVANDGWYPYSSLVEGPDGDLYGTTTYGGAGSDPLSNFGYGIAFRITPSGQMTILHSFGDASVLHDGLYPDCGLTLGGDGNFYGTTHNGGAASKGTIFRMTPAGTVTVLHSFGDGSVTGDGWYPVSAPVEGSDSSFYGTTEWGGSTATSDPPLGYGTVFKLTPAAMLNLHPLAIKGGNQVTASLNIYNPASTKLEIALSSSDPQHASVTKKIEIVPGHSRVSFPIETQPVAALENVVITATLPSGPVTGNLVLKP